MSPVGLKGVAAGVYMAVGEGEADAKEVVGGTRLVVGVVAVTLGLGVGF